MKITPVLLKNVIVDDRFWTPRIEQIRWVTIPFQWEVLNDRVPGADKSGSVMNFKIAAGRAKGEFYGAPWQDSDLAKWIEGVAYSLAARPDPKLEATADDMIDLIAAAQDKDGYVNTAYTLRDRDKRWTNMMLCHELYVMGHLTEAAVAYYGATGKRKFMDVMARCADHIATVFGRGEGQKRGYCGHEEIELALVKLYRATGEKKYLELSRYFIDERGRKPYYFEIEAKTRGENVPGWVHGMQYFQCHEPVRDQTEAVGHSVRAMYLYTAMADLAAECDDRRLLTACKRLWEDVVTRKMYVTGGVGSSGSREAFGVAYELPNESAYTETCAAIGLVFWAKRMLALEQNRTYADVMERALYNGILSGISLDGRSFFYSNPLAARPGSKADGARATRRTPWFGCACCPPNVVRLFASLGEYIYGQAADEVFVHLYVGGGAVLNIGGRHVDIHQATEYPWKETVRLTITPETTASFTLALRIPGWCRAAVLKVNGKIVKIGPILAKGYARLRREWSAGDTVDLTLPMPVERTYANPKVGADTGRAALQRGPLVYCLEGEDNGPDLNAIILPRASRLTATFDRKLLGGAVTIRGKAIREVSHGGLYQSAPAKKKTVTIKAVPYYMWANRQESEMLVWVREG